MTTTSTAHISRSRLYKFARFWDTVGYTDENLRSSYYDSVINAVAYKKIFLSKKKEQVINTNNLLTYFILIQT